MRQTAIILLVLCALCSACKGNPDKGAYDAFMASDFGVGARFNMLSSELRATMGEPKARTEKMGGATEEWHYLNPESEEFSQDAPLINDATAQTTFIFHEEKLAGVYNRYYHDGSSPNPPYFLEPVKGVKLGNRLSDFEAALGPAESETVGHEWRFESREEGVVRVLAQFDPITENSSELICNSLRVVWSPPITIDRGEDLAPVSK